MRWQDAEDYLREMSVSPKRTLRIVAFIAIVVGAGALLTSFMSEAGRKIIDPDGDKSVWIQMDPDQKKLAAFQREEALRIHKEQLACIEKTFANDIALNRKFGASMEYVNGGKANIDTTCPGRFNQMYYDHLNAWEEKLVIEDAIEKLNSSENIEVVIVNGVLCKILGCPDENNPIVLAADQSNLLNQKSAEASGKIKRTWQDLERYAIGEGVRVPTA